jgi:DNA replication terminus site-binding protein
MYMTLDNAQSIIANDLRAIVNELEDTLESLNRAIDESDLVQAKIYPLDRITKEEEVTEPNYIHCEPIYDEKALSIAKSAFKDFYTKEKMSSKCVYRCPGAIQLQTDQPIALEKLITRINWLKLRFKDLLQEAGDRDAKFDVAHQAIPSVITTQVMRKIHVRFDALQSVGFTWGRNPWSEAHTKVSAMEMVNKARKYKRPIDGSMSWDQIIDHNMQKINTLPSSAKLSQRRVLRATTMMNVRDADGFNKRIDGGIPIVVINQPGKFKINKLTDYDKAKRDLQTKRKDKLTEDLPFLEHFNLYLVK